MGSQVKGPSNLALLKMVPHQWPVALVVIWHIYSCLAYSLEVSARDLLSSGKAFLGQGQVPCEFWANRPNFIFQPVAPDMIWHIYSGQCCFKGVLGMDLLSSGDVALMMGQDPLSFEEIGQPSFFSRWLLMWFGTFTHSRPASRGMVVGTCHLQGRQSLPWGRSPVNFKQIGQPSFFSRRLPSWFGTFTHTYTAPWGMIVGTCHLQGRQPLSWWRSPLSFGQISLVVVFQGKSWDKGPSSLALPRMVHHQCQWLQMKFGTFTHTCTASQGIVVGTCHLQGRQPLPWQRSPVSFEQISQTSFFSRWLLMWFGTFTLGSAASQGMLISTCHLQGRQPLPWGRSPMSFGQIILGVVFQGKSWDKGPSSLALPRMVHHSWLAAPDVIWHIYSHLYCSSRDGDIHLPSRGEADPTMGQGPCEFRADQKNFIFQPVAPDVIWHIYSHLYCFSRDGGRDLPSSGGAVPTMGKVPCEFWADWPGCSFSGKELRQGSFQPCHAQDGASSMAGSSWRDLAHLLTPVLLSEGWWQGLAIFRGGSPYHGAGPLWVSSRSAKLHFSVGGSLCDLAHLLTPVLLIEGWWQGLVIFRGGSPYHGAGPLWVLSRSANLNFSAGGSWHDLAHLLGQCCLVEDGAIHLLSSGEVLSGLGKVPCKSPVECNICWRQ